jgi:hypothetical protein
MVPPKIFADFQTHPLFGAYASAAAGGFAEEPERVVVSAPEVSGSINQYFVLNSQDMLA